MTFIFVQNHPTTKAPKASEVFENRRTGNLAVEEK